MNPFLSRVRSGAVGLTIVLSLVPTAALFGQCCGGEGGLSANVLNPALGSWSSHVSGGDPKISVRNTGTTPADVQFGPATITVAPGKTRLTTLHSIPSGSQPLVEGQPLKISVGPSGGAPPAGEKASISWDMGPKKPAKCKKKTKAGSDEGKKCGTKTTLPSGGSNSATAQCDDAKAGSNEPPSSPKAPQGQGRQVTAPPGMKNPNGTATPASGTAQLNSGKQSASYSVGNSAYDDFSEGVLGANDKLAEVPSYTLRGQNPAVSEVEVQNLGAGNKAWLASAGLMTMRQLVPPPGNNAPGAKLEINAYRPSTYYVSSNVVIVAYPHKVTTITQLDPASGATDPHLQRPAALYSTGTLSTVKLQDEVTGADMGSKHTTIWAGSSGGIEYQCNRETAQAPGGSPVLLREEVIDTTYDLANRVRTEKMTVTEAGVISEIKSRTIRLFSWGEEVIEEIQYLDGLADPKLINRFDFWEVPSATTAANLDAEIEILGLNYGTVKLHTTLRTVTSGEVVADWEAMWTQIGNDSTINMSLTPWGNGPAVPTGSATIATLTSMAALTSVRTTSETFDSNGKLTGSETKVGATILEKSSDSDTSEVNSSITDYADATTSYLTVTTRDPGYNWYLLPTAILKVLANRTYYSDDDLISRTLHSYSRAYPSTTPADPNLAVTTQPGGFTGAAPYEVMWTSVREFQGSATDSGRTGFGSNDRVFKECRLTNTETGDLLVQRRYLSTTEVSSSDVFDIPSSDNTLLESRVWTYDAAHRPLTLKVNGAIRESWTYTANGLNTTTVHIDEKGVQTTTVTDAWERPISGTLHANGSAGQTDVFTSWNYASRGSGLAGLVTTTVVSNSSGTWSRLSIKTTDGAGNLIASKDPTGLELTFTTGLETNGTLVRETLQTGVTGPIESKTWLRDGELYSSGGSAVVAKGYERLVVSNYSTEVKTYVNPVTPAYPMASGRIEAASRTYNALEDTSTERLRNGTGSWTTTNFIYDAHGRVQASSNAGGSAGLFYEVHNWEKLSSGGHAHDTALSTDTVYHTSDTNRRRTVTRYTLQAPYGSGTPVWWEAEEESLPNPTNGEWLAAAAIQRNPLEEKSISTLGGGIPTGETVDGGLVSTFSLLRNLPARTLTQRLYRLGGLSRTTTIVNGLATTFNTPDMGTHTLAYSPLREPLAEVSYETLPWWPVLTLYESTGQVKTRHLSKTTNTADATLKTGNYTYYPPTDIRAGQLQTLTETSTGGVTTYDYNARGQLTSQSGTGVCKSWLNAPFIFPRIWR